LSVLCANIEPEPCPQSDLATVTSVWR
jgi:hypothetical protein